MDQLTLKAFLETVPPGKVYAITDFMVRKNDTTHVAAPQIQLHCSSDECDGLRFFAPMDQPWLNSGKHNDKFLDYACRNCSKSFKTYAIAAYWEADEKAWHVYKYGEDPSFGPPTPSRTISLIGGERELFLMGRRSENQGMGIGAFVYYRRVIESQKNRIFDEVARVISKISPNDPVLADLAAAKKEVQFTKAVEALKHGLPQSLFINGYNPLTLLHSALSEGVHQHNDAECLQLAGSVRTVLVEFAERLAQALKDDAELNSAVNLLANRRSGS